MDELLFLRQNMLRGEVISTMSLPANGNITSKMESLALPANLDDGKRNGHWKTLNAGGSLHSEITYDKGSGEYREYYDERKT